MVISQFHLAVPVKSLEEARHFYTTIIGAKEGRSTYNHIDFDLYGHHFVAHLAPENSSVFQAFDSDFHGENVPVPHFGVNLSREDWLALAQRISSHGYVYSDPPHIRMKDTPGEHATLFVRDPSGNSLEFKAFKNHDEVFSQVFDPKTSNMDALEGLVASATS